MGKASRRKAEAKNPEFMAASRAKMQRIVGTSELQFQSSKNPEEKISHALQRLLALESSEETPLAELQYMLSLIVIAWNVSFFGAEKQSKLLDEYFAENFVEASDVVKQEFMAVIKKLMFVKQMYYPDDNRLVASHEVRRVGSRLLVSAAALVRPAENN